MAVPAEEGNMRLIYNDLGAALSVKSCYSRFMSTASLLVLLLLLSSALLLEGEMLPTSYADIHASLRDVQ